MKKAFLVLLLTVLGFSGLTGSEAKQKVKVNEYAALQECRNFPKLPTDILRYIDTFNGRTEIIKVKPPSYIDEQYMISRPSSSQSGSLEFPEDPYPIGCHFDQSTKEYFGAILKKNKKGERELLELIPGANFCRRDGSDLLFGNQTALSRLLNSNRYKVICHRRIIVREEPPLLAASKEFEARQKNARGEFEKLQSENNHLKHENRKRVERERKVIGATIIGCVATWMFGKLISSWWK